MGQYESTDGESSRRNPDDNKCSKHIRFEAHRFAEGRFRSVHKGIWMKPKSKEGQTSVVKHLKSTYTWNPTDWNTTVKIYDEARNFAKDFASFNNSRKIEFTEVHVMKCIRSSNTGNGHGPKLNEYCIAEDYIPGRYTKWCNNGGYWNSGESTAYLQAFVHWSWWHSGSERMIADLQGVYDDYHYTLTDPAILSLRGGYDSTDMGVVGMVVMLQNHSCNYICRHLPKPDKYDIMSCISESELETCTQILSAVGDATTYRHEIQVSNYAKTQLAAKLRSIAKR